MVVSVPVRDGVDGRCIGRVGVEREGQEARGTVHVVCRLVVEVLVLSLLAGAAGVKAQPGVDDVPRR